MNLFPVEYSTLSREALQKLIEDKYHLNPIVNFYFLKRGFNDTYLIETTNSKYILRVYKYNWKTEAEIKNEIIFLNSLSENDVHVASAICDKKNNFIQFINAPEGIRHAVLFNFAHGNQVRKLNTEQSFLLGRQTAKIHLLSQGKINSVSRFNYTYENLFEDAVKTIFPLLKDYTVSKEMMNNLQEKFKTKFKSIDKTQVSHGMCHGDLHAENFHLNNNDITFFDFDFSGNGNLIYDIGVFIWYDHKNKTKEIIESFLKGYQTQKLLTATEIELLPYYSTLRAIFQMTLFCKTNNGNQLPIWPTNQIADFIIKIDDWHTKNTAYPMFNI